MPTHDEHRRPALLEARGLSFSRNDEPIFGPLDFALHEGETVLVEGDNGAGKSTLLRVLAGLLAPTAGEVRLHGEPLTLANLSPQVALLSHHNGLKQELTAIENLRFAAGLHGMRQGLSPVSALAAVGLDAFGDVPTRQLSAGQKKRVALARVLLAPVGLWLLDEPYANLDRGGIELVNRLLETHAHRGGAALITSHGAYAYTSGAPRRIALAVPPPAQRGEMPAGQRGAKPDLLMQRPGEKRPLHPFGESPSVGGRTSAPQAGETET